MRRVLVTGANKGIGKAIVQAVLQQAADTFVFLGSRDESRGEAARAELVTEQPSHAERIEVVRLDVKSDSSVTAAAERVSAACGAEGLYGLVNNAGLGFGLEVDMRETLEVNILGMRRVCQAFIPMIPAGGRVVNITSAAGPSFVAKCSRERQRFFVDPDVEWSDIQAVIDECLAIDEGEEAFAARGLGSGHPYGISKACANSYTMLLARKHPELVINACTPGYIATERTIRYAESQGKTPAEMGMKPPSEGTRSAIHLLFGDVTTSGRYYGSDALRSPLDRYRSPGSPAYEG